ncbi:MAG TPA: hypothetical protein VFN48_05280 [Solirubrobacteraceae bacterium]|nr:hypothetical protein [Solirubrobacteraceae bacterium]
MTVAVAVLGVLVAALGLFVLALLRSHAEILRRLASLEASVDAGVPLSGSGPSGGRRGGLEVRPPGARLRRGERAADVGGQTLEGDAVHVSLTGPAAPPTLLAFMGSTCSSCRPLWEGLHEGPVPTPAGARLLVITKGPERERLARLLELAPAGVEVVMSTPAWQDFAVPSTPHFVLVRDGLIAGRGAATSWEQITGFLSDAADDEAIHAARAGRPGDPSGAEARAGRRLSTEARALRAEQALAEAGIGPGHPSLYPTRGASVADPSDPSDPSQETSA